ncbi:DUF6427 family protein [uncultured Flavobacterium sp.]|uniref:DUF6427 family protein n=1 Tax=uncultured Flavobacterium sp. TaxID=165435 RepID=UPI0025E4D2FC|nr:DUF6427 family protein [uncultured Flavobacterium sp.]
MLASVFNKSRPINYLLIGFALVLLYFLYIFKKNYWITSAYSIIQNIGLLFVLLGSLVLVNFIAHKNALSKTNTYAMLLYLIFLLLFPVALDDPNILISNFFILLALRRLISLQSLITPKEKIFDASFWIFAAAIFHFWSIAYILLVFISIAYHVSHDYRNWVIPFISFFAIIVLFSLAVLIIDMDFLMHIAESVSISFDFNYFENVYQNIAMVLFTMVSALFLFPYVLSINKKPINAQASHKKILFAFLIGISIYVFSDAKSNGLLAFTFAPLAIMGANYLESLENAVVKEIVFGIIFLSGVLLFGMQLL